MEWILTGITYDCKIHKPEVLLLAIQRLALSTLEPAPPHLNILIPDG